jgi:eukaryotic-like serine/threonine-protein kinase
VATTVAARLETGLVLARYRPVRPLGSGGSGSVWLALDERSGREVALKVVSREGKVGARAEREAQVVSRLRHERCQRTYEIAHDEEHVYIAYEFVPGKTLRQAIRAGEVTDATALEAAAQVLEALAYAHGRGIVHRDVKPANVLLVEGDDVAVCLLDFGLAQLLDGEPLTAVGDVPGTLAYIAPERLAGGNGSPASDVWAVGVLLWEALAGWHPFWGPSLTATARKIRAGAPPLQTARQDLPRPLLAAVDRALERDPERRPAAAELAEQLRRAAEGRRRPSKTKPRLPATSELPRIAGRVAPAALAALVAGWSAATFPFYPAGWPAALALLSATLTLLHARAGLALALAVPVLPLGNLSLGVALAYAAVALAWLCVYFRRPRAGLVFAAGPLLAPLSGFALLALVAQPARGTIRRALAASGGVLTAGLVCGIEGWRLPFSAEHGAPNLEFDATESPFGAAEAVAVAVAERPELLIGALAVGLAAALLPLARRSGAWGISALGGGLLAAGVLLAPQAAALPFAASVWALCLALAVAERANAPR